MTKRPTLIVREVMREFGKRDVWTNKYKTMRAVKCYAARGRAGERNDAKMREAIEKALAKVGVKIVGVNTMAYSDARGYGPHNSYIVRLPLKV